MWETPTIVNPDAGSILKTVTFSDCIVRKTEGDPLGLNRVLVECPVKSHIGKENYTGWVAVAGMPIGGTHNKGDTGISWPMSPRQSGVLVYIDGDPMNAIMFPAGPFSESKDSKEGLLPKETVNAIKKKQGHNTYQLKTPDGAGVTITTEVNKEQLAIHSASGACLVFNNGIKGKEPTQKEKEETKPRPEKVYSRGDDSAADGTQKSPAEILKDGSASIRLLGQNGGGISMIDAKDGSSVTMRAADGHKSDKGPSIVMSSKDGGSIILTAGNAQIQIRGKTGDIKFGPHIIQELVKDEVEKRMKEYQRSLEETSKNSYYKDVIEN